MYLFLNKHGYFIFSAIGIVLALAFALYRIQIKKSSLRQLVFMISVTALGALAGAKILYMLSLIPSFLKTGIAPTFSEALGGFVFYGGLLGGILGFYIGCKLEALSFAELSEGITPAIPFFHIFGRIGCICAGCCYGKAAFWGIVPPYLDNIPRIPVRLIESLFNLLLFILLLIMSKKKIGHLLEIYLTAYALFRFANEFMRGDADRGFFGPLSTSQWVSVIILTVISILTLLRVINADKNKC